jgi:hypothetical protein
LLSVPASANEAAEDPMRTLLAILPLLMTIVTGCGGQTLDADGHALASGAGDATAALEYSLASGSLVANLDLAGGQVHQAVTVTVDALNVVFGSCLRLEVQEAPSVHIGLDFKGCGVPFTKLAFTGAMTVDGGRDANGATTLDMVFDQLNVVDAMIDGQLHLKADQDQFSYSVKNLTLGYGDKLVTIEGAGFSRHSVDAVTFSGTGTIAYEGRILGYKADQVHRSFRGCYADGGTIEVFFSGVTDDPITATIHFGDDASGKAKMDYRGATFDIQLPARTCG